MIPSPPELRGPDHAVGGIVYFGRMLDKIRLHLANRLPEDLHEFRGQGFDGRTSRFLRISYPSLVDRVREGGTDEELLEWCFANGRRPEEDEIEIWNTFMRKHGLKDAATPRLEWRKQQSGLEGRADIETMFQYINADEGRPVTPLG